jgi:two-component system, response regulator PdtaR
MSRILIVEDNMIIALVTQRTLEVAGHEVIATACESKEAIKICKENCPDLVLMDIQLDNGGDGVDTMIEIRKFSQVPVIFLTGNSEIKSREKANQAGFTGFLIKPVQPKALIQLIKSTL